MPGVRRKQWNPASNSQAWLAAGWHRHKVPDALIYALAGEFWAFQKDLTDGHLSVFVGLEPEGWHLSMSHRLNTNPPVPGRYPTWDEIKEARYLLCPPEITMAQLLPPADLFVNVHETTFHLWEVPEEVWGIK